MDIHISGVTDSYSVLTTYMGTGWLEYLIYSCSLEYIDRSVILKDMRLAKQFGLS